MQVFRSRFLVVLCLVTLTTVGVFAQAKVSKTDATRFATKLAQIQKNGTTPRKGTAARSTQVTDAEVNSYLKFLAGSQVPVGIVEPTLHAAGNGRVTGRAIVDLDAVRKQKAPTSLLDPMNYLMGRLAVTAVGTLRTADGVGRFELESSSVGSIPVPKILLQEIVSYYSRSPEKPSGISLDDPFALPARIREIQVDRGQAIIVQ
jgi:hypothetical protein